MKEKIKNLIGDYGPFMLSGALFGGAICLYGEASQKIGARSLLNGLIALAKENQDQKEE